MRKLIRNLNPCGGKMQYAWIIYKKKGESYELLLVVINQRKGQLMTWESRNRIQESRWGIMFQSNDCKRRQKGAKCAKARNECAVLSILMGETLKPLKVQRGLLHSSLVLLHSRNNKSCNFSYEIQFLKKSMCRCFHFHFITSLRRKRRVPRSDDDADLCSGLEGNGKRFGSGLKTFLYVVVV